MNRRRTYIADEPNNKIRHFERAIKRESNRLSFILYNCARGMVVKGLNCTHIELFNIAMIEFFFYEIANLTGFKAPTT
jgi:hypothetical protein